MKLSFFLTIVVATNLITFSAQAKEPVTALQVTSDNFVRAESDMYFSNIVKNGGFSHYSHAREVAPINKQNVIRLNRDTLYSSAVFDLDAGPVTVEIPNPHGRFISLQAIDEDQYTHGVYYHQGKYTFTREKVGTRYIALPIRILVNPNDPEDIREAHRLQDAIASYQSSKGKFEIPSWDENSQTKVRSALLSLGSLLKDTSHMYGSRSQVDPVRFLIGAAIGWGANPEKDAIYLNVTPLKNNGKTIYRLTVKDVPVEGFWSVSVYNKEGYYEKNEQDAYTINNITAIKQNDGRINIQFGGCSSEVKNCLPIVDGWNYMVRLYRPSEDILLGKWMFPEAKPQ